MVPARIGAGCGGVDTRFALAVPYNFLGHNWRSLVGGKAQSNF